MTGYERKTFDLERVHNRRLQRADLNDALQLATDGELNYFGEIAGLWSGSNRTCVRAMGSALTVNIDAERARREMAWNLGQAHFDTIAAELQPEPLPTGPMTGIERWSELPPDALPELPPEQ